MKKIFALILAFLFAACSNYQEEFDNNFGALEYADDVGYSSSSGGDDPLPSSSDVDNPSSSSVPTSSSAEPQSSEAVPTQSSEKLSSSSAESSSSAKSSSSVKSSSSETSSSSSSFGSSGSFTYVINSKTYTSSYVRHNGLIWMDQDLVNSVWGHSSGEWNGVLKYFTWSEAKKACPNGWRLPKSEEIRKSRNLENSTSFNDSGALAGYFLYTKWHKVGEEGMYWTSDTTGGYAEVFSLKKNGGAGKIVSVNIGFEDKSVMLPVRCVQPSGNMFNEPRSSSLSIKLSKEKIYDSTYVTVTIGDQTWMAENLLYYYNFGDAEKCYDGNKALCRVYGNYFTWNSSQQIDEKCSTYDSKWILPTESDVNTLIETVGGADKLASVGMEGTNAAEFDIVPSGHYAKGAVFKTVEESEYPACFWLFADAIYDESDAFYESDAFCIKKDLTGSIVKLPVAEYHPIRLIRNPSCR